MCISPITEFRISAQIFPADIESSNKTNPPINHCNFTMITIIYTELQFTKYCRKELCHMDAFCFQPFPVLIMHGATPHTVKQHTYLYALSRLTDQHFLNLLPQFIPLNNIILQMNITSRVFHFPEKCFELLLTICVNTNVIIICKHRLTGIQVV